VFGVADRSRIMFSGLNFRVLPLALFAEISCVTLVSVILLRRFVGGPG
jgi:hypothetical protein